MLDKKLPDVWLKTNIEAKSIDKKPSQKRKLENVTSPIDYSIKKPKLIETNAREKDDATNRESIFQSIYSQAKNFATNLFKTKTNETERTTDNNLNLSKSSPFTTATEKASNFNVVYDSKNIFHDNKTGGSPPAFSTEVFRSKFSVNDRLARLRHDLATNSTKETIPNNFLGNCDTKIGSGSELQRSKMHSSKVRNSLSSLKMKETKENNFF